MYVAVVPNRSSRPAILLRESYRDGDKVKNRTLANLSDWSPEKIEALRAALRGDKLVPAGEGMEIVRALPHGHVAAALGMASQIELDELLPDGSERQRNLALALIVERLIDPAAKLATARALDERTALNSLGLTLGLGEVTVKEVYAALDWLGMAQSSIEDALARRHLHDGTLVLYDVSRATSRDVAASWRASVIRGITVLTRCRSCTGFCAQLMDARSRSRCSKATPAIRRRSAIRLRSSRSASILRAS